MSSSPETRSSRVATTITLLLSSLFGLFLTETGYRIYLYCTQPESFFPLLKANEHPSFFYYQDSPYRYHEEFGYEYVPGVSVGGYIHDGKVLACHDRLSVTNDLGNKGRIKGSFEDADLEILVFGDSWTTVASGEESVTWPDFLQDDLEEALERSVHVLNFGRDGYGLLQIFDLAVAKIPEWKPDLAIFAFITDDLYRDRFWRMKTIVDGYEHIMVSVKPDPDAAFEEASDLYFMNPKATSEWCRALHASHEEGDAIVRELEEVVLEAERRSTLRSDLLSLSQSFVLDLVLHRQPFQSTLTRARPSQWPRHEMRDFAEDPRMVTNIKKIEETGIPYVLVHFAYYPELKQGKEYIGTKDQERETALLESLHRLTGKPVYETLDHVDWPIENEKLRSFSRSFPNDHHPSRQGAQFYAQMVAEVLLRHRYVLPGRTEQ